MLFDYGEPEIIKDIEEYIKHGCYPFCHRLSFADEVDDYLKEDIAELNRLNKEHGFKCLYVDFDKIVLRKFSGLNKKYYNGRLLVEAYKHMGWNAPKELNELGVLRLKDQDVKGSWYHENINEIGKRVGGCHFGGEKKSVTFYAMYSTPLDVVHRFYHEVGHNLQDLTGIFRFGKNDRTDYELYQQEVFAETFAFEMMLLKTGNGLEEEKAKEFVLEKSMASSGFMENIDFSHYNSFAVIKRLLADNSIGTPEEKQKLCTQGGKIDFIKVAERARDFVEKYKLSENEYTQYSGFRYERGCEKGSKNERWYKDCVLAGRMNQECKSTKYGKLWYFSRCLMQAKSQQEIYELLNNKIFFSGCEKELAHFDRLNEKYNYRWRYYKTMKRVEEKIGVKRLFDIAKEKIKKSGKKLTFQMSNLVNMNRDGR